MSSPANPSRTPVLIVDDEPAILVALRTTLEYQNFDVVATANPQRALHELEEHEFAVIISDQRMPTMTGLEFFAEARRIQPDASRVLITGMVDPPTLIKSINEGEIYRFIAKPWLREEMIATVRNAAHRYELVQQNRQLLAETIELNKQNLAANRDLAVKISELEDHRQKLATKNEELGHRYELSLELCCRILATYDPELASRTQAIAGLVEQLLTSPRFTAEEGLALRASAWLCDLGLIGVSRDLLVKFRQDPDTLSDKAVAEIQNHPTYSQTLATHVDGRSMVAQIIRSHHERFDGDGYPDGLSGQAITWPARCLAAVVLMVESELPFDEAIERVKQESGRALDPQAVDLICRYTTAAADSYFVRREPRPNQPGSRADNTIYRSNGSSLARSTSSSARAITPLFTPASPQPSPAQSSRVPS
jgi:response regulator RpfG family c-di-GMP phosphodiesterase